MAERFDAHTVDNRLPYAGVVVAGTKTGQQIGGIILTETWIQFSLGGYPYPVARIAKIVTVRRNESIRDSLPGVRQ